MSRFMSARKCKKLLEADLHVVHMVDFHETWTSLGFHHFLNQDWPPGGVLSKNTTIFSRVSSLHTK